jgi:hypothetical protein
MSSTSVDGLGVLMFVGSEAEVITHRGGVFSALARAANEKKNKIAAKTAKAVVSIGKGENKAAILFFFSSPAKSAPSKHVYDLLPRERIILSSGW